MYYRYYLNMKLAHETIMKASMALIYLSYTYLTENATILSKSNNSYVIFCFFTFYNSHKSFYWSKKFCFINFQTTRDFRTVIKFAPFLFLLMDIQRWEIMFLGNTNRIRCHVVFYFQNFLFTEFNLDVCFDF